LKKKKLNYSEPIVNLINSYVEKGNSYIDSILELEYHLKMEAYEIVELLPEYLINIIKKEFIEKNYKINLNKTDTRLKKSMSNKKDISSILSILK